MDTKYFENCLHLYRTCHRVGLTQHSQWWVTTSHSWVRNVVGVPGYESQQGLFGIFKLCSLLLVRL